MNRDNIKSTGLKILHIVPHAVRGGVEKNCFHFIQSMSGVYHEVLVLGDDGPMVAEWESCGVNVKIARLLQRNLFAFYKLLQQSLPPGNFDKVIVWTNLRMPAVVAALNKYYPTEIFVHVGNPVTTESFKSLMFSSLWPVKNKIFLRAVSAYVQESFAANGYYRKFQSKVSLKPIFPSPVAIERPVDITTNFPVRFGMTARLDDIKDHETVIRAFQLIRNQFPLSTLHLAGDGNARAALEKLVTTLQLQAAVFFLGDVADIYEAMKEWNIFLYATTMREGLGGTVPEALSMGLPVVSSDLPMTREWDPDGTYVVYSEAGNPSDMAHKTIELIKDISHRKFVFESAPVHIRKNFAPAEFSAAYIAVS